MIFLLTDVGPFQASKLMPVQRVRNALKESVMRRTTMNKIFQVWGLIGRNAIIDVILFMRIVDCIKQSICTHVTCWVTWSKVLSLWCIVRFFFCFFLIFCGKIGNSLSLNLGSA